MNVLNTKILVLAAMMLSSVAINAQKFGFLNSNQLLAELPEVKSADSELETFQAQLVTSGEKMVKDLDAKIQTYSKQAQEGTLSQVQMQQKEAELTQEQQKIQAYELEVQNKILKKREEVLQPIMDRVKTAIEEVGKENGYTMIFDSNAGTILHASESENVMALVKAKLGM